MSERVLLQVLCPVRIDSLSKVCEVFPGAFVRQVGSVVFRGQACNVIELFDDADDAKDDLFKLNDLTIETQKEVLDECPNQMP